MATGMARDMDMAMEAIGLMDMGIATVSCMGLMVDMEEVLEMEAVMDMGITGRLATLVSKTSLYSSGQAQYKCITSYHALIKRKENVDCRELCFSQYNCTGSGF